MHKKIRTSGITNRICCSRCWRRMFSCETVSGPSELKHTASNLAEHLRMLKTTGQVPRPCLSESWMSEVIGWPTHLLVWLSHIQTQIWEDDVFRGSSSLLRCCFLYTSSLHHRRASSLSFFMIPLTAFWQLQSNGHEFIGLCNNVCCETICLHVFNTMNSAFNTVCLLIMIMIGSSQALDLGP